MIMKQIELTQGGFVLVDDDDFDRISKMGKWQLSTNGYAFRVVRIKGQGRKQKHFSMHRFIMGAKALEQVDHINGNKLDNRKCNLRICTNSSNNRNVGIKKSNTSGFKGIRFDKRRGKWHAQIRIDGGKRKVSKGFETPIEAAKVYNEWALEYHGEFACTNKIPAWN